MFYSISTKYLNDEQRTRYDNMREIIRQNEKARGEIEQSEPTVVSISETLVNTKVGVNDIIMQGRR